MLVRRRLERRGIQKRKKQIQQGLQQKMEGQIGDKRVEADLEANVRFIVDLLGDSSDVITRRFTIQYLPDREAALLFIDGMTDGNGMDEFILAPLMLEGEQIQVKSDLWDLITKSLVHVGETNKSNEMKELVDSLLSGDAVLFVEGYSEGMAINAKGWKQRGVEEPKTESVVRGSREGFTETLRVNTGLVRRRLKDPDLRLKDLKVGRRTNTNVTVLYIEGVAEPDTVEEVIGRIRKIEIDGILESGYIEELIQDHVWTPFPLIQNTERPDSVVSHLLEGKVAIITDGTPHVLIAPAVFAQFYYSPEDYYERYLIASFLRLIRLLSFVIALLLPALYIAFVSFHPEMIPSSLAIAIAAGRSTVAFPSIVEVFLMEISVEILREASVRLPGPIGPTIGIVGALVVGDAAVTAGLVSPLMVIVVGLTTISSYANPSYNAAISVRLLRFPLMISAAVIGLYGIMIFLMLLLYHMINLRSFNVPYMAPFSPFRLSDIKDSLIRVPWKWMKKRPKVFRPLDPQREEVKQDESP